MGLGRICHEHCPRLPSGVADLLDGAAGIVVLAIFAAAASALVVLLWHILLIVATWIGMLVIGSTAGYWWKVRPRRKAKQLVVREAALRATGLNQVGRGSQQAIDGGQHLHIHLPPGISEEDARRYSGILRGEQ